MFVTEEEASTKWCPFVRISGHNRIDNPLTDGFEDAPKPYHCIGSKCMQWRAIHGTHMKAPAAKEFQLQGYCGLAGKPVFE